MVIVLQYSNLYYFSARAAAAGAVERVVVAHSTFSLLFDWEYGLYQRTK